MKMSAAIRLVAHLFLADTAANSLVPRGFLALVNATATLLPSRGLPSKTETNPSPTIPVPPAEQTP